MKNLIRLSYRDDEPTFNIFRHFSCSSSSVIYLIQCSSCNSVYVGETGRALRERMTSHRFDIAHDKDTPVAEHFSQHGHDFMVSVIQHTSENLVTRRLVEKRWISRFRSSRDYVLLNRDDGISALTL